MNRLFRVLCFLSFLLGTFQVVSCSPELPNDVAEAYAALPDEMDYNLHVKPILSDKCFSCHGPDMAKQKAGLRLDMPLSAFADLPESPEKVAIDPGDLNGSELFHRILSDVPEYKMPSQKSNLFSGSLIFAEAIALESCLYVADITISLHNFLLSQPDSI